MTHSVLLDPGASLPSQRKNLDSPTLISLCVGVTCTWMAAVEGVAGRGEGSGMDKMYTLLVKKKERHRSGRGSE